MPKRTQAAITLGSAVVSAALLSVVYAPVTVALVMAIIITHEFGHYFAAHGKTPAYLPIFIPLIFAVAGITAVERHTDSNIMYHIYRQGSVWGICASALLCVICWQFGAIYTAIRAAVIGMYEVYGISFGGDARRIRSLTTKKKG